MGIAWFTEKRVGEAAEAARSGGRPVFADFWFPGCKGCAKMDAVTYRDSATTEFLSENFVAIKYNTAEAGADLKRLVPGAPVLWTPTLVVFDPQLREVRRLVGYLSPGELVAELSLGLGLVDLLHARPAEAYARFEELTRSTPEAAAVPEAFYWWGVAAFRANGRSLDALAPKWEELRSRFPRSPWAERADVLAAAAAA